MLGCVGFWRTAVAANVKLDYSAIVLLCVLNLIFSASDMIKPLEWSVVGPRVKNRDTGTSLSLLGHLFWAVFIFHLKGR